jgi:nitrate reductase assembly molybdenum cofactor insertion protein NarJ
MKDLSHYDDLAIVLDYPTSTYLDDVERAKEMLAERYPRAAEQFERFYELVPRGDLDTRQELYTRTFEVQAIATLDVGYTLFGDDYKRGALLANLNGEHRKAENPCITELADHLPTVLRLLARTADEEFRHELVTELVAPAVRRMILEFVPEQLPTKDLLYKKHYKTVIDVDEKTRTIYGSTLQALYEMLRVDFGLKVSPQVLQTSEFLRGIGTEMKTEDCAECAQTT